jgi:hypothetical protein
MARLDVVFEKYDLKTLEAAVERRRRQEQRRLNGLLSKRKKLELDLKNIDRELRVAMEEARRSRASGQIKRKPNARRLNDITLAEALEKVMKGRKTPIHYKELTEAVVKRGLYRTKSKNLLSTVAVTLKRDKRFKKVEPGLYVLR